MKIAIIIPAHNEEKRIGHTLSLYSSYFENLRKKTHPKKFDYEILVVINATNDKTEEIVKNFKKKNKRISYLNLIKGGKGYAIIEGFKHALKKDFDFLGFVDADAATPPKAFYDLIKNINGFDGIIASRYVKGAIVNPKQSIQRIIVSRIFNFLVRILFLMPYKDTQCGAKIFKKIVIEKIIDKIGITQWAFDVDLLYQIKKEGFRIKEFPTIWSDKEYSKINFVKSGPRMALSIIRLRLINSKLKFIVRGYDMLPDWLKIHTKILK